MTAYLVLAALTAAIVVATVALTLGLLVLFVTMTGGAA